MSRFWAKGRRGDHAIKYCTAQDASEAAEMFEQGDEEKLPSGDQLYSDDLEDK